MYITTTHTYIYKIKKLIQKYYNLEFGVLIHKYNELLKISNNPKVYISRRALKHFVESRSKEMKGKYEDFTVLERLYFAIENLETVIRTPDTYMCENNIKHIYAKHFGLDFKSSVRIVIEEIKDSLQVKSIHFQRK